MLYITLINYVRNNEDRIILDKGMEDASKPLKWLILINLAMSIVIFIIETMITQDKVSNFFYD